MFKGKKTCKILKEIRAQIAAENDILYITSECKHQGDCPGTCPKCEAEVRYLEKELEKRAKLGKAVTVAGLAATITVTSLSATACRKIQQTDGDMALPPPQIPITERTEDFLAVELTQEPADFIGQSDQFIYATLKAALAEAHCLEEDERYVFWLQWRNKLRSTYVQEDTVRDTYRISYHLDEETWMETSEFLRLTFSSTGVLLAATYEKFEIEYVTGDMDVPLDITDTNSAQKFTASEELLSEMNEFIHRLAHSDEVDRKVLRARWAEDYTYTRGDTDYYTISEGRVYKENSMSYTLEELTTPRYLALTFAEDGTLTAAVITQEP